MISFNISYSYIKMWSRPVVARMSEAVWRRLRRKISEMGYCGVCYEGGGCHLLRAHISPPSSPLYLSLLLYISLLYFSSKYTSSSLFLHFTLSLKGGRGLSDTALLVRVHIMRMWCLTPLNRIGTELELHILSPLSFISPSLSPLFLL